MGVGYETVSTVKGLVSLASRASSFQRLVSYFTFLNSQAHSPSAHVASAEDIPSLVFGVVVVQLIPYELVDRDFLLVPNPFCPVHIRLYHLPCFSQTFTPEYHQAARHGHAGVDRRCFCVID